MYVPKMFLFAVASYIGGWLKEHEALAIWLEGIALVAIFIFDRIDSHYAHKETLKQMAIMQSQADAAKANAEAARLNAQAVLNSERAWIAGELVHKQDLGIHRYSLQVRNLGKTPAQIRSYQISVGPLTEGSAFSPEKLSSQSEHNLHIFIGSGEVEPLEEGMDMDKLFPTDEAICFEEGAFYVVIKYADVVTGTPDDRTEHETSFVYLYTPFLQSVERLSVFNNYS